MKPFVFLMTTVCVCGMLAGLIRPSRAQPAEDAAAAKPAAWIAKLEQIADIATVMMDGDDCMTIVTDRAAEKIHFPHPNDRFFAGDNYDVNFEPFRRTKKLLIRLGMLAEFPVDCNLWLRTKKNRTKVHMVIRQVNSWSRYWSFGQMTRDPSEKMAEALAGKRVTLPNGRGDFVAVLTPVRDSLGDVVGFVEVCARRPESE